LGESKTAALIPGMGETVVTSVFSDGYRRQQVSCNQSLAQEGRYESTTTSLFADLIFDAATNGK